MSIRRLLATLLLLVSLPLSAATPVQAPEPALAIIPTANAALSTASLESRIRELESQAEKDVLAGKALELYRDALVLNKQADEDREQTAGFKNAIDEAAARKRYLQDELERTRARGRQEPAAESALNLVELEQLYAQVAAELQLAARNVSLIEEQLAKERVRPETSGNELAAARKRLEELELKAKSQPPLSGDDAESMARRVNMNAALEAAKARINRLEMERLSYAPRLEQLTLKAEWEREVLKRSEKRQQALQGQLQQRRVAEVEQARIETQQAQLEALDKHPLLREAAAENARLSEQLAGVSRQIEAAISARDSVASQLKLVQHNLERVQQQLDIIGLDEKLGLVLRKQRQELPDLNRIQTRISLRRQEISEARLVQFQIEEQLQELLTEAESVAGLEAGMLPDVEEEGLPRLKDELSKLLNDRRDLLDKLKLAYSRYEGELSEIILDRVQLSDKVDQYGRLLDRHLVWTPSTGRLSLDTLNRAMISALWFLSPENWMDALQGMSDRVVQSPLRIALLGLLVIVLLRLRRRLLGELEDMAQCIGKVTRDGFFLTVKASIYTLLLALPWVILVVVLALLLVRSDPGAFVEAVTVGVRRIAAFFLLVQLIRYFFIQYGVGESHFRLKSQLVVTCRRNLKWLVPALMPLVFIVGLTEWQLDNAHKDGLGRIAFLASVLVIALFAHRLLNPWSGLIRRDPQLGWQPRLLWYPLTLGLLLLLFGLAFGGYYYSALTLESLLFWSVIISCAIYYIYNLAIRWMLVTDRRLAFTHAIAKRQAALEARASKEATGSTPSGESIPDIKELEESNLATISEQTRRILQLLAFLSAVVGLGLLWSQLMPALGKLDDLVLWEHLGEGGQPIPVSLWDGMLALLVLVLTLLAGRNLPGLLEFALLQPLALSPGNRYAISMISSYLIYGSGFVFFSNMVGLSWGDIQWLIAAMGVGLGFGLKEIFSNFFSGLILLFERPLRVGDTVTIGDISGTVSRIRMRATTITDWDNKELVVPNVKFLTDPMVNWTLTDTVTRVTVKLGIAYGSDTEKAYQLIKGVVASLPDIMQEPPPAVFFLGFGESSLDYTIYAFVNDRSKRLPVMHDLHMQLNKALKEAGIEIPFPQRDLHLRTVDGVIVERIRAREDQPGDG